MTKRAVLSRRSRALARRLGGGALFLVLAGCGGGGNPLSNPPSVANPQSEGGQKLSFAYFQRCVNPVLLAQLPIHGTNPPVFNSCANSGCHADETGPGGAFRIRPNAQAVPLTEPAESIRESDMYKNFYSAQGEVVLTDPALSRLQTKPRVQVLHGGGLIFDNDQDPNLRLIQYWMTHPVPAGQDEFTTVNYGSLFVGGDPEAGACITQ